MPAALLFQLLSLLVGIGLVPLLLRFLGAEEYLAWTLFTTIGALALQVESAIQTVMVRRLATALARKDATEIRNEMGSASHAYRILAATIALLVFPAGGAYFQGAVFGASGHAAPQDWWVAWTTFCAAYAVNFAFGPNNVLLLASARTSSYFVANSISRLLNFLGATAGLALGMALPAVAIAFAAAVIVNVNVVAGLARKARLGVGGLQRNEPSPSGTLREPIWKLVGPYFAFSVASFCLYRGAYLIVAPLLDTETAGSYGLALQTMTIIQGVATIPVTVRLSRMVHAIEGRDVARQDRETCIAFLFATLSVLGGICGLSIAGPIILDLIDSTVALPATLILATLGFGILLESLCALLSSRLILGKDYGFVRPYVHSVTLSGVVALAVGWATGSAIVGVLAGPALVQSVYAVPALVRSFAAASGRSSNALLADCARALRGVSR